MSRKVSYARTHQNVHVPHTGELGNVFPPQSKTLENLTMTVDSMGLTIEFTFKGLKQELLIPSANVVIMRLLPEEKPVTPIKVVKAA